MRRVITASLNGNAYQIEDDAYAVLATYLENATRALAGNPDKDEIIADVEQAIADKCARYLTSHKTVIALGEINQILTEMGPVDGGEAAPAAAAREPGSAAGAKNEAAPGAAPADSPGATRRLYQISDGALVSGVCNGIAAFFHLDVTLVRVVFVVLVFLTGGLALGAYLVLMFVVPYAKTSEQHAEAHGIPFNARTLVEGAKEKAAAFTHGGNWRQSRAEWRAEWRRTRAQWREQRLHARAERLAERYARPTPFAPASSAPPHVPYAAHLLGGFIATIMGLVLAAITIGWIFAILSLVTTGAIFGWFLPLGLPLWIGILLLCIFYSLVSWPIKAFRHASYHLQPPYQAPRGPFEGVIGVAVVVILCWYGYHHVPELREFFDHIRQFWSSTVDI